MADSEERTEGEARENWEKDVLNRLAFATLNERRRARRWGIFFKLLLFAYLFLLLWLIWPSDFGEAGLHHARHTALIDISGVIAEGAEANADDVVGALRKAFGDANAAGVILRINSPGGSPVQAGIIYDEIRRLRKAHPDKPLYTVVTDICASGGYYIAAASDAIYANRASIVGSIGVLMNGFGFVGTMDKLGVERRLYTAGKHKAFLDPFSPIKESDVAHIHKMLDDIHQQFIDAVRAGRGKRLKDNPSLYSGLVWTGDEAVGLGLVDKLADTRYVAEKVIGAKEIVDYTPKPHYLELLAQRVGTAAAGAFAKVIGWGDGAVLR